MGNDGCKAQDNAGGGQDEQAVKDGPAGNVNHFTGALAGTPVENHAMAKSKRSKIGKCVHPVASVLTPV